MDGGHEASRRTVSTGTRRRDLLLAAHALGLGAVGTGVYPQQERVEAFRRLLGLPKNLTPHSLVALGYPAE